MENSVPYDYSRAQQEDERLFFPGKDSDNKKPWILLTIVLASFYPL